MEVQHVFYGLDGRNPQEDPQVKELVKTQRINETCKENCNFLTQAEYERKKQKEG